MKAKHNLESEKFKMRQQFRKEFKQLIQEAEMKQEETQKHNSELAQQIRP